MVNGLATDVDGHGLGGSPRGRGFFGPGERWLILAAALWPALWAAWSQGAFPGVAAPDELSVVAVLSRGSLGQGLHFGGGGLTLAAFMGWAHWAPHQAAWLQALPSAALGLEALLLAALGARWAGPQAGVAAALINAVAAFSLLRARTLLAYSFLPLELLTLLWALPLLQRRAGALAWGALAALLLLEYEAWACALPGLAWAAQRRRPRWGCLAAGFIVGAVAVGWLSAPAWDAYLQRRAALGTFQQPGLGARLALAAGAYFAGLSGGAHELGPWPAFPLWALPAALVGLLALAGSQPGLALLAFVGLLPLAAGGGVVEARRAVVAWPALCLAAGCGLGAWLQARPRWSAWALAALLPLAGAEAWGLDRGLAARDAVTYGLSRRAAAAAEALRQADPGATERLLDLSGTNHAWEAWWLPSAPGGVRWALVPGAYAPPALRAQADAWIPVRVEGAAPVVWVRPKPALALRLVAAEALGRSLFPGPDSTDDAGLQARALDGLDRESDPWLRSLRLEAALGAGLKLGQPAEAVLQALEGPSQASANACLMAAAWLASRDPARAARLARRATEIDPRRAPAWRLRAQLAAAAGDPAQAGRDAAEAAATEDW